MALDLFWPSPIQYGEINGVYDSIVCLSRLLRRRKPFAIIDESMELYDAIAGDRRVNFSRHLISNRFVSLGELIEAIHHQIYFYNNLRIRTQLKNAACGVRLSGMRFKQRSATFKFCQKLVEECLKNGDLPHNEVTHGR
jgi:hypothetical protein